jgi:ribosomal protein S27AE
MKRGTCPKCDTQIVFHYPGHHLQREMITLKSGVISTGAAPDRYICASCGYTEYYLSAEADLTNPTPDTGAQPCRN